MHDLIERGLEDYLSGLPSRAMDSHLAACAGCRREVEQVRQVGKLLNTFRSDEILAPSIAFSSRVLRAVRTERSQSVWSVLTVDTAFARKFALASLLGLAALGGYLATQPTDSALFSQDTPEAAMASHDVSAPGVQQHRDQMLVTLATYQH